jgi:hypothetical protein
VAAGSSTAGARDDAPTDEGGGIGGRDFLCKREEGRLPLPGLRGTVEEEDDDEVERSVTGESVRSDDVREGDSPVEDESADARAPCLPIDSL